MLHKTLKQDATAKSGDRAMPEPVNFLLDASSRLERYVHSLICLCECHWTTWEAEDTTEAVCRRRRDLRKKDNGGQLENRARDGRDLRDSLVLVAYASFQDLCTMRKCSVAAAAVSAF